MTEEEIGAAVRDLKEGFAQLNEEWTEFLKIESQKRANDDKKVSEEVNEWEKRQTFLHKHGAKVAGIIFTIITSGLAWYGSQIEAGIKAEQKAQAAEQKIEENSRKISELKDSSEKSINELKKHAVNQTIMIADGFERVDKLILKANPRQFSDESDLPPPSPEFERTAKAARRKKVEYEAFGE